MTDSPEMREQWQRLDRLRTRLHRSDATAEDVAAYEALRQELDADDFAERAFAGVDDGDEPYARPVRRVLVVTVALLTAIALALGVGAPILFRTDSPAPVEAP